MVSLDNEEIGFGGTVSQHAGSVVAVHRSPDHRFSKASEQSIRLIAGRGVAGDAHKGEFVKHRSRVARDPTQPNLRQVHLIHAELLEELRIAGFQVDAGDLGENITTRSIDLLALPAGARLHVGNRAVIEITGLRNPCKQLDDFQPGLMKAVLDRDDRGNLVRKAGVMGIVVDSGIVEPNDRIEITLPSGPLLPLHPV